MNPRRNLSVARKRMILAVAALLCVIVGGAVLLDPPIRSGSQPDPSQPSAPNAISPPGTPPAHWEPERPKDNSPSEAPPAHWEADKPKDNSPSVSPPNPGPPLESGTSFTDEDLDYLASRNLLIPLAGKSASDLRDNFYQGRSEGRQHNALDIMAPQATPVLATADGAVRKLFTSDKGGITLYEIDTSGRYVYYYAHLMGYADGIVEGRQLRRGDVIAYVGDTGNAGAYHLHFAISKISSARQWSGGDPINPYPLLVRSRQ